MSGAGPGSGSAGGHDDFQVEPVRGLPETPPEGERILWQGSPDWRVLARRAFWVRTVAFYFGALALWRFASVWADGGTLADGLWAGFWYVLLGGAAIGLLVLMAWTAARAAVYTITTRRVAMRIGVALTVTLNLPYRWIGEADLKVNADGSGDIALSLTGGTRLAYLMLWPHARPWRFGRAQPTLRAIPGAQATAAILVNAMQADIAERGGAALAESGISVSGAPASAGRRPTAQIIAAE